MRRSIFAALLTFLSLLAAAQTPDPHQDIVDRLESFTTKSLPDWRYHADVPHPEAYTLNDSSWPTVRLDERWSSGSRVLRRKIDIPPYFNGYAIKGASLKLDLAFDSNGPLVISIFSNGNLVYHGTDTAQQPILLTENAMPGQQILIAVRLDAQEVETRISRSRLLVIPQPDRPNPALIREEILALTPMIAAFPEGRAERERQFNDALQSINFTALKNGQLAVFDKSLATAQSKLEALNPWLKQFTIRIVGNSHIDMAWLWPWTETVEVVRNTFRSALDLMREYPDFKFTMSSARTYEWMEEKYPDLFKEIEQHVKEGRWEIVGGMWVEPDLNMPSGESLTRQILVGKRYFEKKFGLDTRIGWNPDSFGYNAQLPQIYKKSGMDYFVTQKLLWAHEFTVFPYKLFWWEAPDGSRLLTYFPHDYGGEIDPQVMATDLSEWAPAIYGQKPTVPVETIHLYGVGDHGGGPTRTMLDNALRLKDPHAVFPTLQFSNATDFFANLEKKLPSLNIPVWKDELYFQYHRGVFTTQAETKRRIRLSEETLLDAEKFSSLATLYGRRYPQDDMQRAWKRLLFEHFHDIMPGSGIAVNYLDAQRNLADVRRTGADIIHNAQSEIAARINTQAPRAEGRVAPPADQSEAVPVLIFNSLSWLRTDTIEVEAQLPTPATQIEASDAKGKSAPSQLLSIDPQTHRARFLLQVNVPSMGYATYFIRPSTTATTAAGPAVKATADTLENEFLRLKIDPQSGCMTSLFDKKTNTEALAPAESDTGGPKDSICGNLLQTFVDKPKDYDAWNIDADFEQKYWSLDKADEVKLLKSGPLEAAIRVKKHFQNSTFTQDITLYAGSPRVDVKFHASWHEKHILLKVAFPLSAHSPKATYEIPYGTVERPTTRNTPAEKGQFEVPALQWADISDASHGLSLLNDCKYGYDAKGNVLRLSLLRSPEWPDPHADEGDHDFIYSLYPHAGTWREAQTIRRGYELNDRLFAMQVNQHEGTLPPEYSFLQLQPDNVVVTALKKAEDDKTLILRFYEWSGKESEVVLQVPKTATSAAETDLIEHRISSLSVNAGAITVHTKPYEIKTVKINFGQGTEDDIANQP
jgi:alpha-mannosidase